MLGLVGAERVSAKRRVFQAQVILSSPSMFATRSSAKADGSIMTTPAAAPAPKRARVPHRSPLVSLWARNDIADSVVAFLPGTNLSKLPVIAKPFRAAQPLVLFTAARRLKVLTRAQDAFLDVLREVTPDRQWFRETWTEGLARWQMDDDAADLTADIVGSPPHLRLRGTDPGRREHAGLSHRFSRSRGRSLAVKNFRARVTFPVGAANEGVGYVWLCVIESMMMRMPLAASTAAIGEQTNLTLMLLNRRIGWGC